MEAVFKKLGPVTYSVDVGDGRIWKRHIDQLTERFGARDTPDSPRDALNDDDGFQYPAQPEPEREPEPVREAELARLVPPPQRRVYP